MSLFERSLFMCYMAGAGQITAEAGGALAFLNTVGEDGFYLLSPYGEVCKRLRDFSLAHPDIGLPCTPFGVVLDFHHGAYMGSVERKAFGHFDYNAGDDMTWNLIDMIWPDGWEVMGKDEAGTMVNGPYGDTFDILLQNAPQAVLDSYPCLILSGDLRLSGGEAARFRNFVEQGGTLLLNTAFLEQFPEYASAGREDTPATLRSGKGRVVLCGPDYSVAQLDGILREELSARLPVRVSGDIQYLVNIIEDGVLVTLINNAGVTKAPRSRPVTDPAQRKAVTIAWTAGDRVESVTDIKNDRAHVPVDNSVSIDVPPGGIVILEMRTRRASGRP
jgi:hypothetical protein